MAARKSVEERLAAIHAEELKIKEQDAERRAKRVIKIDEVDATLVERIDKLQAQRVELKEERNTLTAEAGVSLTKSDEV